MGFLRKILLIAIINLVVDANGAQLPALPVAAAALGANVLDFDTIVNINTNIPAIFQPKIYEPAGYNAAGPNNLRYVYFSVFNPGEVEGGNFQRAVVRSPLQADNNIFFPMDGHQPTTEEAVEYSCANIDNREDSSITEWYMKMFGVIPFQNTGNPADDHIKAGWSAPVVADGEAINAQRIVSFDFALFFQNTLLRNLIQLGDAINVYNGAHPGHAIPMPNIDGTNLNILNIEQLNGQTQANVQALINALQGNIHLALGMQVNPALQFAYNNAINNLCFLNNMLMQAIPPLNQPMSVDFLQRVVLQNCFKDSFKAIATSPVGRVLLYRLLIEIRRRQALGNNAGTVANDADGLNHLTRDYNRSITICCGDFSFQGIFFANLVNNQPARINFNNAQCRLCTIGGNFGSEDIIRLHNVQCEVALFHEMIHWYHRLRAPGRQNNFWINDANPFTRRNNFLWLTYWSPLQTEERKLFSERQWTSLNNRFFDQEEVFTILGMPSSNRNAVFPQLVNLAGHPQLQVRKCYLEGDDLCENLYRACFGMALRFGYHTTPFTENSAVIKNVTDAIDGNIKPFVYMLGNYRFVD